METLDEPLTIQKLTTQMIMDGHAGYQTEALKTASMGKGRALEGFVRVCGLVGEAGELRAELKKWRGPAGALGDVVKTEKELGDVMWYASTLGEWLKVAVNFNFANLQSTAGRTVFLESYYDAILVPATELAEMLKKHLGHDKPLDAFKGREVELMMNVWMAIAYVANTVGLDLAHVAAVNVRKLQLRHGGKGFTAAGQNAKADERGPEALTS